VVVILVAVVDTVNSVLASSIIVKFVVILGRIMLQVRLDS
jgi:hypothetical protein